MTPLLKNSQQMYQVNCPECGGIAKVVNPLLNRSPYKVTAKYVNPYGLKEWQELEEEDTVCSECGASLTVTFVFDSRYES